MMDYCARESTLNQCDEIRERTIKMNVQEAYKILCDMSAVLEEFAQIITGKMHGETAQKNADSLLEESGLVVALAYENLQKLNEIKRNVI